MELAPLASAEAVMAAARRISPDAVLLDLELGGGQDGPAISREAFVSEGTVRTQIRSILTKLGVNSQLAAVAIARSAEWPRSAAS